jgi:hypothetical protein
MSSSVNAKHLLAMKLQLADNQNGDHLAMRRLTFPTISFHKFLESRLANRAA